MLTLEKKKSIMSSAAVVMEVQDGNNKEKKPMKLKEQKYYRKIHKTRSWFFGKVYKINEPLARLKKEKGHK